MVRIKKTQLVILLGIIFLLCAGFTSLIYWLAYSSRVVDVKKVYAEMAIGDTVGLTADADGLMFGRVLQKGASKRTILLTNTHGKPLFVTVEVEGNIAQLMNFEKNFSLELEETKQVVFGAYAKNLTEGNFSGIVTLAFYKK